MAQRNALRRGSSPLPGVVYKFKLPRPLIPPFLLSSPLNQVDADAEKKDIFVSES